MSSSKISVGDLTINVLDVKVNDKSLKHLIPSVNIPEEVSIEITGVNSAIANGLRRTLMSEIPIKCLYFEYDDFEKDDPYALVDMIQTRIRAIPIKQIVDPSAQFELKAENQSAMYRYVYASEIVQTAGKKQKIFNDQYPICSLQPGKFLTIKNIHIVSGYEYEFAGHCAAFSGVILPLDVVPIDIYTGIGVSSSVSNPHDYLLKFTTNGTMDAKDILTSACDSIILRIKNILNILDTIKPSNDVYTLHVDGETDTIGNLLAKTIYNLYPDIDCITYTDNSIMRSFDLRAKTKDEIGAMMQSAVKDIIEKFSRLKILFAAK